MSSPITILLFILLILLLLWAAAALLRTILLPVRRADYHPAEDPRAEEYARKLSRMVQVDTTSYPNTDQKDVFSRYHRVLEELFPLVHEKLERTDLDGSLLFKWKGLSDGRPIVLLGHQDVVPARGTWKYPPFSGTISDGKVWGRGSVDTKCSCMAFFQAVEELIAADYIPPRDIYLASSCTEEWGGPGCPAIVSELERRGVKPWLVLDEGGGLFTDPVPGVRGNCAMIGIAEKGMADVIFHAHSTGGHASTPGREAPIDRLAAFVCSVRRRSPFRCQLDDITALMLESLAPTAVFPVRLAFRNLWLFRRPIEWFTPRLSPQAAAMLGTTINFTMASGSEACNIVPREATLGANLRFPPHQDMDESLSVLRKAAAAFGLETEVLRSNPCTRQADIHGDAFRLVRDTAEKTFPGCLTSPYLLTAGTDSAFFDDLCDSCIRFAPIVYGHEEKKGIHNTDEALRYDCLPGAVDFYKNLIKQDII